MLISGDYLGGYNTFVIKSHWFFSFLFVKFQTLHKGKKTMNYQHAQLLLFTKEDNVISID